MAFTDSYKHMESLGGKRLQFFLTLFTHAMPGTQASDNIILYSICTHISP